MAKRRTAQELIEENEARIAKLQEKAALDAAKENPILETLYSLLDHANEEIRECQRLLGDGAQSIGTRHTKHLAWLQELEASAALAEDALEAYKARKEEIVRALPAIATSITEGEEENVIRELLDEVERQALKFGPDPDLKEAFETAHQNRLVITNSKKLSI